MWVYQETKTNAAALVPTLPEDTAGESLAEKEAMTPVSEPLAELPPQKAPRRKPFQASRDCILLAAAYLFGTLMAGILQALCDAEEMETLAYYLDCWRGVFAASSTAQAVGLFGAELTVVLGAAAVFLLLGLSAVGPLPIFLFAMLYGTGSGLLSAQRSVSHRRGTYVCGDAAVHHGFEVFFRHVQRERAFAVREGNGCIHGIVPFLRSEYLRNDVETGGRM